MLTFLHAADIHLDSPLLGLSHYDGAPPIEDIRGATRQALDNLVNFALEEKANLTPFQEFAKGHGIAYSKISRRLTPGDLFLHL
jgi:hypothetical protein